ncbi:MAG: methylglutaconyl-CoA hydratase [Fimbriimonadaceae bacterium]|jgi:enoyl-CoA hydratase/carnithine racemase|nr:methylglutaconyl-CoA hydratase [Fimbriimonadaceae bacterium]
MPPLILVEREPGVVTFVFNRSERRNALTVAMLEELVAALENAISDETVRVIILRGAGSSFSSGFDLAEGQDLEASLRHGELLVQVQMLLAEAPQVCIAAAHGYALAGGGAIIAACDYAVAAEDAQFGYPVLKVGIVPTPGMPFLRHELRDRDFRALVLGGELIGGKRAWEIGLVNKVMPTPDDAVEEAKRFASLILQSSPRAVAATKKFSNALTRRDLRHEMEEALEIYKAVRKGDEAAEGLKAFVEKRAPVW